MGWLNLSSSPNSGEWSEAGFVRFPAIPRQWSDEDQCALRAFYQVAAKYLSAPGMNEHQISDMGVVSVRPSSQPPLPRVYGIIRDPRLDRFVQYRRLYSLFLRAGFGTPPDVFSAYRMNESNSVISVTQSQINRIISKDFWDQKSTVTENDDTVVIAKSTKETQVIEIGHTAARPSTANKLNWQTVALRNFLPIIIQWFEHQVFTEQGLSILREWYLLHSEDK